MRTVTFQSILDSIADLMGIVPADMLATDAALLTRRLNKNIRTGWRGYDWPEILLIEQRYFRPVFTIGQTYGLNTELYYAATDSYYTSITANSNASLPTNRTYWTPLTVFARSVALTTTGQTTMGEVLAATRYDPRESDNFQPVNFSLSPTGIQFAATAPNSVWLKFRLPVPQYSSVAWSASLSYATGDVRLFTSDGECYRALSATTPGQSPLTHASKWERQVVPDFLDNYLTGKTYADWLKTDGQQEKSTAERADARESMEDETDELQTQQGQRRRYAVRTR